MKKLIALLLPLLIWLPVHAQLHLSGDTLFVNSGAVFSIGGDLSATDSTFIELQDSLLLRGYLSLDSSVSVTGTGWVNLRGNSLQQIDADGVPLPKLKLENPTGAQLTSDAQIRDSLLFANGKLDIQNHNLTIGSPGLDSGSLSGASASSYVQTSDIGELKRFVNGNTKFPVGNSAYNPAFAHLQNPENLGIRADDTLYESYFPKGNPETENAVNRAWYVRKGAGSNQLQLTTFWQQPQELPGFERDSSFISYFDPVSQQFLSPNEAAPAAAGSSFYSQEGAGFTEFNTWFAVQSKEVGPVQMTCDTIRLVSNGSWMQSTTIAPSSYSGHWSGVEGNLPANGTFTQPVMLGQPYSFQSIFPVDSSRVIKAGNNITFYKKTIYLDSLVDINARIISTMDDQMELYVNGYLLAGQYTSYYKNGRLPGFGAWLNSDSTVVNGAGGSKAYDYLTPEKMDRVFRPGQNEIVYVLRNFAKSTDAGGFSISIEVNGCKGMVPASDTTAMPQDSLTLSLVSDHGWEKSTVVESSNYSGNWSGATSVPLVSTFTLPAIEGQPYPFHSIDAVDSARVIKTENNITFFRREFTLTDHQNLDARFRMTGDDGFEIYINRQLVARENNSVPDNYRNPEHDIRYTAGQNPVNGFNGGDTFDVVAATDLNSAFTTGTNEVVVAIRNKSKTTDLGGFSFRMDLDKSGGAVIAKSDSTRQPPADKSQQLIVYPNPSSGLVNLRFLKNIDSPARVTVYAFNGMLIIQTTMKNQAVLNLTNFSGGVYLIRVSLADRVYTARVIKR